MKLSAARVCMSTSKRCLHYPNTNSNSTFNRMDNGTNKSGMGKMRRLILSLCALTLSLAASAQCTYKNTAFKAGEFLSYNLYYNWKFVWVKAGTASMYTVQSRYKGKPAYRASLTTRGNNRLDDMYVLRDTLLCYSGLGLEPLYYRKGAREGKRYTVDEVWYSYDDNGKTNIRQHRQGNNGKHTYKDASFDHCIFDMMNMLLQARSYDPTNWKKGYCIDFPMADGKGIDKAQLRYRGKTTIKGDNGVKYRCLELSYMEMEDGKYKEIVRFYVTDDKNHVPVRLDMYLRFGSAKAFLTNYKGIKNPITCIVK